MPILSGTAGADILDGSSDADTIYGLGGNDTIDGKAGNDTIDAGAGNDAIEGGTGDDVIDGGDGDDRINDAGGSDTLRGGAGADYIFISRSDNGTTENLRIEGGTGNDQLVYQNYRSGTLTADLGDGDDSIRLLTIQSDGIRLTLGSGRDVVTLESSLTYATSGLLRITDFAAGAAGDSLDWASYLNTTLAGWDGSSNPFGSSGYARLVQSGADTLLQIDRNGTTSGANYATLAVLENVTASQLVAANFGGFAPDGSPLQGQTLTGTANADTLTGTGGADTIYGLGGNDTIDGKAGNDTIDAGAGNDAIEGGTGDDVIDGGDGDDRINDAGGSDTLRGGAGADYIFISRSDNGTTENLRIEGGTGNDQLVYQNYRSGTLTADLGDGDDSIRLLTIQSDGIRLTLGSGRDVVTLESSLTYATSGLLRITDFAAGAAGDSLDWASYLNTTLAGWDGSSNPFGSSGYARLVQSGADTLLQIDRNGTTSGANYATLAVLENVTASQLVAANFGGFAPDGSPLQGQTLTGTANADTLTGTGGADTIYGLGGNDTIDGKAGNDTIDAGAGNDAIEGGTGDDVIDGGDGDDRINDAGGSDTLRGGAGADYIFISRSDNGTTENLRIEGGTGNDQLVYQNYRSGTLTADLGDGDDSIRLLTIQSDGIRLTLGSGRDVVTLESSLTYATSGLLRITDFAAGAAGDSLDWASYLNTTLAGWDGSSNPFGSSGYARLVQSGADTLLQIDRNGTTSGANYATLAVLENVTASQLVAANFEGFAALGVAFLGTSNSDRLTGTDGSDSIYGFDGDDTLVGGAGNDGLIGGTGNDTYFVDAGDTVYESVGQGYDTVAASVSYILNAGASVELLTTGWIDGTAAINLTGNELANQIWGNNGSNVLSGDDGDDALFGFGGSDTLIGGAGNDAIFGGEGADVAIGGLGNDTIYVDDAGDTVVERAGEGYDTVAAGFDYKLNADADVELLTTGWIGGTAAIALTGSDSANEIWGNNGANILNGGAGNDVLLGFDGDDTLVGGAGNDGLIGGTGNDTYFVDAGDTVYESVGQGYDTVAASVSYILNAGASVELLTTGWIDGTAAINLTGNELANQIWGNNGSNVLSGDDGDDALFGFGGSDTLIGGAGNDAIFGGEGADVAIGGLGNDTIYVDDAGDTVVERAGEGYDTVAAGFDYKLNADADVELLTTGWIGGTAAIALTGSDSANEIWGNNGANILNGGAGNDVLVGFDGDDTLVGGAGNDGLIGGSGNDTYLFDTALGRSNIDTIYGFTSGQDRVALDRKIFEGLNVGTLSASAFAVGTSASDADDRIIYNPATGALLFDADGSGSGSAYQFAIFDGNSTLSANDFFVI